MLKNHLSHVMINGYITYVILNKTIPVNPAIKNDNITILRHEIFVNILLTNFIIMLF